jgi:hypothetical protein
LPSTPPSGTTASWKMLSIAQPQLVISAINHSFVFVSLVIRKSHNYHFNSVTTFSLFFCIWPISLWCQAGQPREKYSHSYLLYLPFPIYISYSHFLFLFPNSNFLFLFFPVSSSYSYLYFLFVFLFLFLFPILSNR